MTKAVVFLLRFFPSAITALGSRGNASNLIYVGSSDKDFFEKRRVQCGGFAFACNLFCAGFRFRKLNAVLRSTPKFSAA
jgi:hypothetical protein